MNEELSKPSSLKTTKFPRYFTADSCTAFYAESRVEDCSSLERSEKNRIYTAICKYCIVRKWLKVQSQLRGRLRLPPWSFRLCFSPAFASHNCSISSQKWRYRLGYESSVSGQDFCHSRTAPIRTLYLPMLSH